MLDSQLITPKRLARTYDGGYYDDAWTVVEQYRQVMAYSSRHPNMGSGAIASRLNLPRPRVRPWLDGAVPDPVRAKNATKYLYELAALIESVADETVTATENKITISAGAARELGQVR